MKELFTYNSKTGIFVRLCTAGGQVAGTKAGTIDAHGYLIIRVDGKSYKAHRLAWLYVYGKLPKVRLDHIDEIRLNNRIKNLRLSDARRNAENVTSQQTNNTSGFKGVHYLKRLDKWQAYIRVNKILKHLGVFDTPELASNAYLEAKRKYHIGK